MDSQTHKINRNLVIGWLVIVGVLFVSYCGEVIKGERNIPYLIIFMLVTALPAFICLILYWKNPVREKMQYYIVVGYFIFYLFSMLTGSTNMVFSYILPMLSLLVLYHDPKLILYTGISSVLVNLISIGKKVSLGELTIENSKDAEIQIALLILCFTGSYLAARLYDEITSQNHAYLKMMDENNNQIQKITLQSIMTIADIIDTRDEFARDHSERVAEYSTMLAEELGLPSEEIQQVRISALLHDIGKIGVPDAVLNKPGRLTEEEYEKMKKHTICGGEILKDIEMLQGVDVVARHHHERYDGSGYPDGLCYDEIPYYARIVAVADAYDAMTSNRVYRERLSIERVYQEIEEGIGLQFDPEIASALLRMLDEGKLKNVMPEEEEFPGF